MHHPRSFSFLRTTAAMLVCVSVAQVALAAGLRQSSGTADASAADHAAVQATQPTPSMHSPASSGGHSNYGNRDYGRSAWIQRLGRAYANATPAKRAELATRTVAALAAAGELDQALSVAAGESGPGRLECLGAIGDALISSGNFAAAPGFSNALESMTANDDPDAVAVLALRHDILVRGGYVQQAEIIFAEHRSELLDAGLEWTTARDRLRAHAVSEAMFRSLAVAEKVLDTLRDEGVSELNLAEIETAMMLRAAREGDVDRAADLLEELDSTRRLRDADAAREVREFLFRSKLARGSALIALEDAVDYARDFSDNDLLVDAIRALGSNSDPAAIERIQAAVQPHDRQGADRVALAASAAHIRADRIERAETEINAVTTFDFDGCLDVMRAYLDKDSSDRAASMMGRTPELQFALLVELARRAALSEKPELFRHQVDVARAQAAAKSLWPRILIAEMAAEVNQRHVATTELDLLYRTVIGSGATSGDTARQVVALDFERRGGFGLELALRGEVSPDVELEMTLLALEALTSRPIAG